MKRKLLFRGTGTALVTPFKPSGEIDNVSLKRLLDFQIQKGVEAIIPAGTTGESASLSEAEQISLINLVVQHAKGKVKIIAGAGANDTSKAIKLAKLAYATGADAILSVAPYYNKPTQEGIFRHYQMIAEEVPVIVYNVPGRTSCNIEAETTLRIAEEIPNVIGIKEASGNISQIMEILRNRPEGFGVWSGDDAITLPLIALGADGVISVVSNEIPGLFSKMVRLALSGKIEEAKKIHYKILPLMNFNFIESNPIPVKAVLAEMKMIEEVYRLPLVPLSDKHRDKMKKILRELKVV
ncbi:MAG: 4-hydroxy-tetrahydrodipicolinate synthase [Ignavibacteriae bacterium]|nr:MAG: 4-hydroxy-tetrahydrodipicolinate synthase [Ignavibacteriota bacterium]